jgi:DNA-directed RNA polymerase subunit omega
MYLKDQKTVEMLKKLYPNDFELVNYAIKLAKNMLHTGRDPRVKIPSRNAATIVLEEVAQGVDKFDEIVTKETVEFEEKPIDHKPELRPKKRKILKNLRTI